MQRYIFIPFIFSCSFLFGQLNIQQAIDAFLKHKSNANATVSFMAIDLKEDKILAAHNENAAIPSASIAKLLSTATAFEVLGKDYKMQTRIYTDGKLIEDSVLTGNIWIRGGGDVSLGSKFFNESGKELRFLEDWADSLLSKGIKRIKGAIIADGSSFGYTGVPDGWNWSDIGNYYGAGAGGINILDNTIRLFFRTGKLGSMTQIVDMYPEVPGLMFKNTVVSANVGGDDAYIYGAPFSLDRSAAGKLPINQSHFEVRGSLPDPEYQLALEFYKMLVKKGFYIEQLPVGRRTLGLKMNNTYDESFQLLLTHEGKTVKEIAYWTNLRSMNLFAEALLNQVGYFKSNDGSTDNALREFMDFWKDKVNLEGINLKDGSGLSRNNAISANHFCQVLKYMYHSINFEDYKSTLPVAGQSGTAKNLCKGQAGENRVYAKSGTINRIKAYAGYVESKSGKIIAYSFMINNFEGSATEMKHLMEPVLNAMANQ